MSIYLHQNSWRHQVVATARGARRRVSACRHRFFWWWGRYVTWDWWEMGKRFAAKMTPEERQAQPFIHIFHWPDIVPKIAKISIRMDRGRGNAVTMGVTSPGQRRVITRMGKLVPAIHHTLQISQFALCHVHAPGPFE